MSKWDKKRSKKLAELARSGEDGGERRSRLAAAALGREGDSRASAYVALKYYCPAYQCFSEWSPEELQAFSEFCGKVSGRTWPEIYASGGRGGRKVGLGYDAVPVERLPNVAGRQPDLSEDITWCELRVTDKARVFGFRAEHAFFLVYLDRNHEILP